jgi:hypothetical protein
MNIDDVIVHLKLIHKRDGADAAVQAAKEMIEVAAAVIAHEHGPDSARRFLEIVGAAQEVPPS